MLEYPSISEVRLKLTVARNSLKTTSTVLSISSSFFGSSSVVTNGMLRPSVVLTYIFVLRAPVLSIFKYQVLDSPKITSPKSISGSSTAINAFLQVQINGMFIYPVSAKIGKKLLISSFNQGVKVIVIVVERPALMRPVGAYTI